MSDRRRAWRWVVAVGACGALVACAAPGGSTGGSTAPTTAGSIAMSPDETAAGTTAPALPECTGGALPTVTDGMLTFGTGSPALEPWFAGDPASGQGLESAVATEVAGVLGYQSDQVSWVQVDRAEAVSGGATGFDLALDQFTAAESATTVDYSTGYFPVTEVLVMRAGTPAPTLAALGALRVGAVGGAPGGSLVMSAATVTPTGYPDESGALTALTTGEVDGVLLPIQDALAAARADPAVAVVGQLPVDPQTQPEQFRALLPGGSALTGCVSAAIDRLRVEGALDALATQWVTPLVPVLG
jgi:polar amino acid transport system substrate-binding protein